MNKYDDLKKLETLREQGAISEDEFQREKSKILNSRSSSDLWGMEENTFLALMNISQFAGFIVPGLGFVLPIVMWQTNRDNEKVDLHGKNIANFMISMIIYLAISAVLCFVLIGIPMLVVLGLLELIFVILATVKAANGEYWKYPMSIRFFS